MICFYCGNETVDDQVCPYCGKDQRAYRMIMVAANRYYNDGLKKAKVRDLSGAAESLHRCLRMDKYYTIARNLLGLVYFEMGQTVLALREWVLSKNLQPDDNPVDRYLAVVQRPGALSRLDSVTQKYNLALSYCRQGSPDLARIQLKRIISSNPKMIAAHQLLALILIQDGKYDEARRSLAAAARIDVKNPVTIAYIDAIRSQLRNSKKRRKKKNETGADISSVNEVAVMPKVGILDVIDRNGNGIINIITGIAFGILVAVFLIVPTMRQNDNSQAQSALVSANKEAANSANNVASLEKQVDSLNKELDKYTGQGDLKTSYEKLIAASQFMEDGEHEAAAEAIAMVNESLLDTNGKAIYSDINGLIQEESAKASYDEGNRAFRSKHYSEAIEPLLAVVEYDESYSDGYALYYLAQSYDYTEDTASAAKYYARFAELFPHTSRGRVASGKAEEYGQQLTEGEETQGYGQQITTEGEEAEEDSQQMPAGEETEEDTQ